MLISIKSPRQVNERYRLIATVEITSGLPVIRELAMETFTRNAPDSPH